MRSPGCVVIVGFLCGPLVVDVDGGSGRPACSPSRFVGFLSMPVAVAVAILRYRLYEIDRVVSRTLVYGALTVVLGAAYLGLVLAGQALFSSFAGGSNLAIAVSTLVVAALFLPMRSHLQGSSTGASIGGATTRNTRSGRSARGSREQVDLDTLDTELRGVVDETMRPTHVSIWLRESPR